ncbi:alpha-amylase family glycosyl hydrolase [Nonomuraea dietziae]|uniref:alpha-amylase family glycosyl hydrolase n=1 Tax=Nonomuraea dietziae TaxID=65515 RepID=UPI0033E0050A
MATVEEIVGQPAPRRVQGAPWPERQGYHPSPSDWRDEVIYFLLPDRFSDGREGDRPLLDRSDLWTARPQGWRWDRWARSGRERYQGGTLSGVASRLEYLDDLGVTALWIGPVWKQRPVAGVEGGPAEPDDYHGYAVQDFMEVDPRLGTRADLVALVRQAHRRGIRVILDVLLNHSGENWDYDLDGQDVVRPPYRAGPPYDFGAWRDGKGGRLPRGIVPTGPDHGVWPEELQSPEAYTRAGGDGGSFGPGGDEDPDAPYRRADWFSRDLDMGTRLQTMIEIYSYWIALADLDGLRVDTLKHVPLEHARAFCGAIREYAERLGKKNFLIVGEVGGGDTIQEKYLKLVGQDLSAVLETGETRATLRAVAEGQAAPEELFNRFTLPLDISHRALGSRYVSMLDDHDDLAITPQLRFGMAESAPERTVVGAGLLLFLLGIPCLYYGMEQGLTGPEPEERRWLPGWGVRDLAGDIYLREAMFGPEHPRELGGHAPDPSTPGFGPFGTSGHHVFDQGNEVYQRVRMLLRARAAHPVLSAGRQYLRALGRADGSFTAPAAGEVVGWSRILAGDEALCVINPSATESRTARLHVDAGLNATATAFTVVANTAEVGGATKHPVGSTVPVLPSPDGARYVEIQDLPPLSVLVAVNR